jgi:hypothetical protein
MKLADLLKALDLSDIGTLLKEAVPYVDVLMAGVSNPFVKIGWKIVRAFLMSDRAAQAVHDAITKAQQAPAAS